MPKIRTHKESARAPSPVRQAFVVASAIFSFSTLCAVGGAALYASEPEIASAPAPGELVLGAPRNEAVEAAAAAPAAVMAEGGWTQAPLLNESGPPLQCAIYARQRSGIALTGEARNWWPAAEGRYERSHRPQVGAVMVMGGTESGHVAVVARVLNAREILVDHANWAGRGEIQTGALVRDVSEANDWSSVAVWHIPSNGLGVRPYPVYGFVLPTPVANPRPT